MLSIVHGEKKAKVLVWGHGGSGEVKEEARELSLRREEAGEGGSNHRLLLQEGWLGGAGERRADSRDRMSSSKDATQEEA